MNKSKSIRQIARSIGLITASGLLSANVSSEPAIYANMEVGVNYWDIEYLQDDFSLGIAGAVGLRIHSMLRLELGYQYFGSMNFVVDSSTEGELDAQSFSGQAVINIPVNKELSGFILAGVEEMDYTETSTGATATFDLDEDGGNVFGIGVLLKRDANSEYRLSLASHADGDIIRLSIGGNLDLFSF